MKFQDSSFNGLKVTVGTKSVTHPRTHAPTHAPKAICENKDADQLCGNRTADQRLCFRYMDSTIPLLPKSEFSSLYSSPVAVQPVSWRTWSKAPKTGFLTSRLQYVTGP